MKQSYPSSEQRIAKIQHVDKKVYQKVNAYTKKPAFQQITAIVIFTIVLILHSIFIVPPIVAISKHTVLIFLLSLHFCFLLLIGYDYLVLTVGDPVDSLVQESAQQSLQERDQLRYCEECCKNRFSKSYHCKVCGRCTENFDHHCRYLNNCIGGKNYQQFFRLLVVLTIYFINIIIQAVWIFALSFQNEEMQDYMISKWPVLIVVILMVLLILAIDSLLVYHLYLNLVRHMTTVEYIFRDTSSNQSTSVNSETDQSVDTVQGQNC